jgi:cytoskeletal protein CcmA (bactofilin family)
MISVPLASQALVAKSGDTVMSNEVIEGNFFGAGNLVTIDGTVNGDVFVAGNNITITGMVNGDVFVAGSSIEISGTVNGNVRVAGSNINIRGLIERNILGAGSSLILGESASVGGHITFAGASFVDNSPVGGQIDFAGGSAILNNNVGGDVSVNLEDEGKLILMSEANLDGNLYYKSLKEAEVEEGAIISGITKYEPWKKGEKISKKNDFDKKESLAFFKVGFLVAKFFSLISLFIIGLILLKMAPKPIDRMYDTMKKKFWPSVGWGFAVLFLTPIVCLILLITIIGIPLSGIVFLAYILVLCFAKALVGLAVGKWIVEKFKWKMHAVWSLLIGLVVLMLINMIPVAGWVVCFVLFLWALGGVYQIKKEYLREMK